MSRNSKVWLTIIVLVAVAAAGFWFIGGMVSRNRMNSIKNTVAAKEEQNKNLYSEIRNVAKTKADITWLTWDNVHELEVAVAEAMSSGGAVFKSVAVNGDGSPSEQSVHLSADLARSMEALFKQFRDNQDELFRLQAEYNDMRENEPSKWWVSHYPDLEFRVVRAAGADEDFESGVQSDIDVLPPSDSDKD